MENSEELTINNIKRLKAARIFTENSRPITSIDFDSEGKICVTASEDDSINVYDCPRGRHKKLLLSKKYGVHLTRFTHLSSNILYASTKGNEIIRVASLEMSPKDDMFISGAKDDVRLWDLRTRMCVGHLELSSGGTPFVSYDPAGLVFAVGLQSLENSVRLYDVRKFEEGPFGLFKLPDNFSAPSTYPNLPGPPEWTGLKFSNNGLKILINTSGDVHYVIDAFDGKLLRRLVGSQDGKIHVWDIEASVKQSDKILGGLDIKPIHVIDHHVRATQVVRFNPNNLMLASGCRDLIFWLPAENLWKGDDNVNSHNRSIDKMEIIE
nr:13105_t:CDS:2 [Entrophospora candida]